MLVDVFGLPFIESDVAEGGASVQNELVAVAVVVAQWYVVGALVIRRASDDVEVVDAFGHVELEFGQVNLPADEEEKFMNLPVTCGVVDFALEILGRRYAQRGLGCNAWLVKMATDLQD